MNFDSISRLATSRLRTLSLFGLPCKLSSIVDFFPNFELADNLPRVVMLLHRDTDKRLKRVRGIVAGIVQVLGINGQSSKQLGQARRLLFRNSSQTLRVDLAVDILGRAVQLFEVLGVILEVVSDEHDRGRDIRDFRVEIAGLVDTTRVAEDTIQNATSVAELDERAFSEVKAVWTALDETSVDECLVLVRTKM